MRDIPLYKQSFEFSCGPAALMMVMKSLDPDLIIDRSLELDIWRDSALMESRGTSSFGLGLAALRRGYEVVVQTDCRKIGFIDILRDRFPDIDVEFMEMLFDHTRDEATKEGVNWDKRHLYMDDIVRAVNRGSSPIVLISSEMMGEEEGIPHWVVVVEVDEGSVVMNNPETAMRERYERDHFDRYLGFSGNRCMILLEI